MKKIKTSLKKRQHRAGSKTSKKLMMDSNSSSSRRRSRRRSITQLPHCVGTSSYWLLPRSTSHYKLHVSKNLLCWILSALCFSKPWQRSSHYWATHYLATIIPLLGNPLLGNHQSTTGQLGNHHPTTGNSSLRLQPPIPVARAPYLNTIAVFCFPMFSVFPF